MNFIQYKLYNLKKCGTCNNCTPTTYMKANVCISRKVLKGVYLILQDESPITFLIIDSCIERDGYERKL